MVIKRAAVYGFGTLANIEFEPDKNGILNVSKGLIPDTDLFFEFVRAMLYGHTSRNGVSTRKAYMPEDNTDRKGKPVIYGGELIYDACGRTYRLSRFFGRRSDEDITRIVDVISGRDVKIEFGRSVGEKTLHISEGAFISAAKDFGFPPKDNGDGTYSLGKLSSILGTSDGRPSPKEFKKRLNDKLRSLTNPRTKSGRFDQLVIKKMNMKNSISRTGDRDQKLIKLREELDRAEAELSSVDAEIRSSKRLFDLCDAAKTLLAKDRIVSLYDQILASMKQRDFCREEHKRLTKMKLLPKLLLPVACFLIGCFLIFFGISAFKSSQLGWPSEIIGSLMAVLGIVLSVLALYKHINRFVFRTDGRVTTHAEEAVRLESEILLKNEEVLSLLGDSSSGDMLAKWRKSEDVMRSAKDSERRFSILKQSEDLESALSALNAKKEPLSERIEEIHSEIKNVRSTGGVEFSEAVYELDGIDDKIKDLTNEIEAVKIALSAAEKAEKRFYVEIALPLSKTAEEIYFKTSGNKAEFTVDSDYNITCVCGDPELAMLSLRGAISGFISSESDRQLMFIGEKEAEKNYLDVFMRASGVAELVVVNQR